MVNLRMRIAITGASGLVGRHTAALLRARGDTVLQLVRNQSSGPGAVRWDPESGAVDISGLGKIDAMIPLAGDNVASGRWTRTKKQRIHDSRGPVTAKLCATLARQPHKPKVLVCASAVGIYGNRGDEPLDEHSLPGGDFLAKTALHWEAGTVPAREAGIRVVNLRIGLVLDKNGGALPRILRPFRLGVGGRIGSGRQWLSWITLDDLARAIAFCIDRDTLAGPVLAVAPNPVTNREFTTAVGKVLHRPTLLPAPAFALRLLLGEMADGLLLSSQRACPQALLAAGFSFAQQEIEPALRAVLVPGTIPTPFEAGERN